MVAIYASEGSARRQFGRTLRSCTMQILSSARLLACLAALLPVTEPSAFAQLERAFEGHGGVTKWKSFASVEFDQAWTSAKGAKKDPAF